MPKNLIAGEQVKLESHNFRVIVDGLELRKPVFLKGNLAGYTTREIPKQHFKPYGKDIRFHGYIAVQEGLQLKPDELRGILIRIKNVAIGYYDPSKLDYRYNEGPRSRWITGEVYVIEGLEDALNIDRDSFSRFHPQFQSSARVVHKLLREEVFPAVYKQIEVRSTARAGAKRSARTEHFSEVLSDVSDSKVIVHSVPVGTKKEVAQILLVQRALAHTVVFAASPCFVNARCKLKRIHSIGFQTVMTSRYTDW